MHLLGKGTYPERLTIQTGLTESSSVTAAETCKCWGARTTGNNSHRELEEIVPQIVMV